MSPEQIIKEMRVAYDHDYTDDMSEVLRIVLQAIKDGEVVTWVDDCHIELKPDFEKWMENK